MVGVIMAVADAVRLYYNKGSNLFLRGVASTSDLSASHWLCCRKNNTTVYFPLMTSEDASTTSSDLRARVAGTTYTVMKVTPTITGSVATSRVGTNWTVTFSSITASISINVDLEVKVAFSSIAYTTITLPANTTQKTESRKFYFSSAANNPVLTMSFTLFGTYSSVSEGFSSGTAKNLVKKSL